MTPVKRFPAEVTVERVEGGFEIALDGRFLRSPRGRALRLPTRALAEAIAGERRARTSAAKPCAAPLTELVYAARDRAADEREAIVKRLAAWAATDLLCYRAAGPPELAERQRIVWQPLLDWAEARYGARFVVVSGVMPAPPDAAAPAAVRAAVESLDSAVLAALHCAAGASGSIVLALALLERRLDSEQAIAAAQLDERYQAGRWGNDPEAEARRAAAAAQIRAAARFLCLLKA